MDCKDFEQEIYLYRELAKADKEAVDNHIASCTQCRELFVMVQETEALVAKAASIKPQPENASKLTSNIMLAIQAKSQKQSVFASLVQESFLKYSFAAASLVLVILFMTEQQTPPQSEKVVMKGTVVLKSSSIREILDQEEKQKASLYACIKSENCNNTLVENLKQKKFSHENL